IIKVAMIKIDNLIDKKFVGKVQMLLQVHDELVFEVEDDKAFIKQIAEKIQNLMQDVLSEEQSGGVPLVTSSNIGLNWDEMSAL
ncbi:MAG: DNA polymerase, partial [archaeon]